MDIPITSMKFLVNISTLEELLNGHEAGGIGGPVATWEGGGAFRRNIFLPHQVKIETCIIICNLAVQILNIAQKRMFTCNLQGLGSGISCNLGAYFWQKIFSTLRGNRWCRSA